MDATSEKVDATCLAAQAGVSSFRRCEEKATKKELESLSIQFYTSKNMMELEIKLSVKQLYAL